MQRTSSHALASTLTSRPCLDLCLCRYMDFMTEHLKETCKYELKPELRGELETAILHLEVRKACRQHCTPATSPTCIPWTPNHICNTAHQAMRNAAEQHSPSSTATYGVQANTCNIHSMHIPRQQVMQTHHINHVTCTDIANVCLLCCCLRCPVLSCVCCVSLHPCR
jgi:hypothetical protein